MTPDHLTRPQIICGTTILILRNIIIFTDAQPNNDTYVNKLH